MAHIDNESGPSTAPRPSDTLALLDQLKETGQPIVLTIKGTAEFVVRDEGSYQRLCGLVDRLETIDGIERGLNDVKHGRTRSLEEMVEEKRKKYGL